MFDFVVKNISNLCRCVFDILFSEEVLMIILMDQALAWHIAT